MLQYWQSIVILISILAVLIFGFAIIPRCLRKRSAGYKPHETCRGLEASALSDSLSVSVPPVPIYFFVTEARCDSYSV